MLHNMIKPYFRYKLTLTLTLTLMLIFNVQLLKNVDSHACTGEIMLAAC